MCKESCVCVWATFPMIWLWQLVSRPTAMSRHHVVVAALFDWWWLPTDCCGPSRIKLIVKCLEINRMRSSMMWALFIRGLFDGHHGPPLPLLPGWRGNSSICNAIEWVVLVMMYSSAAFTRKRQNFQLPITCNTGNFVRIGEDVTA